MLLSTFTGASGEVYEGILRMDQKKIAVAVKTCHGGQIDREERLKFLEEARLMRRYRHANIVQLHGIAAEEELLMIVMELVPGGSLMRHLRKFGTKVKLKDRIRFCLEAARGMAYLEEQGCIHGDLATRNCLLGKNKEVKISDFGLFNSKKLPVKWLAPETIENCEFKIR